MSLPILDYSFNRSNFNNEHSDTYIIADHLSSTGMHADSVSKPVIGHQQMTCLLIKFIIDWWIKTVHFMLPSLSITTENKSNSFKLFPISLKYQNTCDMNFFFTNWQNCHFRPQTLQFNADLIIKMTFKLKSTIK